MSEDRLVLNTKKSLYDPIEIVIDNQVYQSAKTTKAVLKEINKLDEQRDGIIDKYGIGDIGRGGGDE